MSSFKIKSTLEKYFVDNWGDCEIQFEGVPLDYSGLEKFVSLKYVAVSNSGLYNQNKHTNSQLQIFCYAKNPTETHKLADSVSGFIGCKDFTNDVHSKVPQSIGSAIDLDSEFFECGVFVEVNCYS